MPSQDVKPAKRVSRISPDAARVCLANAALAYRRLVTSRDRYASSALPLNAPPERTGFGDSNLQSTSVQDKSYIVSQNALVQIGQLTLLGHP
jgi:hypothetical protein